MTLQEVTLQGQKFLMSSLPLQLCYTILLAVESRELGWAQLNDWPEAMASLCEALPLIPGGWVLFVPSQWPKSLFSEP